MNHMLLLVEDNSKERLTPHALESLHPAKRIRDIAESYNIGVNAYIQKLVWGVLQL